MAEAGRHRQLILEQFARQAGPFAAARGMADERALRLVVERTEAGPGDTLLDVAGGPGSWSAPSLWPCTTRRGST